MDSPNSLNPLSLTAIRKKDNQASSCFFFYSSMAVLMHSRGSIRHNNTSLLQGLVVFPGSSRGGADADQPD